MNNPGDALSGCGREDASCSADVGDVENPRVSSPVSSVCSQVDDEVASLHCPGKSLLVGEIAGNQIYARRWDGGRRPHERANMHAACAQAADHCAPDKSGCTCDKDGIHGTTAKIHRFTEKVVRMMSKVRWPFREGQGADMAG